MAGPVSRDWTLSVGSEAAGQRLDRFLVRETGLTRAQIQRLIRSGQVRVDGKVTKAGLALREGSRIEMTVPSAVPSHIEPEPIPLDILFEDDSLLVVNKPPGLVVHPGAGVHHGTLVHGLVHHCRDLEGVGGVLRPGIVHRLDKDTSGLLVVAKTHRAHLALVAALAARRVRRVYRALVWGRLIGEGRIEAAIGRDPHDRKRMAVLSRGGKEAITTYLGRESFDFLSDVELTLQTGRTHQIRVHLAFCGHPVFGDPRYGGRTRPLARLAADQRRAAQRLLTLMRRQALHAERLEFEHPETGCVLRFAAPPPDDFSSLVEALREEPDRSMR
jgi:23S rRNA pseudouridine1911/1915/1917 synthase